MPKDIPITEAELVRPKWRLSDEQITYIKQQMKEGVKVVARFSLTSDPGPEWRAIIVNGKIFHKLSGY